MKVINSKYPFRRFLKDLIKNADRNNIKGGEKDLYIRQFLLPLGLLYTNQLPIKRIKPSAWLRMGRIALKQNKLLSIDQVNYAFFCKPNEVGFIENYETI